MLPDSDLLCGIQLILFLQSAFTVNILCILCTLKHTGGQRLQLSPPNLKPHGGFPHTNCLILLPFPLNGMLISCRVWLFRHHLQAFLSQQIKSCISDFFKSIFSNCLVTGHFSQVASIPANQRAGFGFCTSEASGCQRGGARQHCHVYCFNNSDIKLLIQAFCHFVSLFAQAGDGSRGWQRLRSLVAGTGSVPQHIWTPDSCTSGPVCVVLVFPHVPLFFGWCLPVPGAVIELSIPRVQAS